MCAVMGLMLLWLIVAGFYSKLPPVWGVTYALCVLGLFVALQVALPWRLGWSIRTLLRRPTAQAMAVGAAAAALAFCAGVLWLAAFGFVGRSATGVIAPAQVYVGVFLFPVVEEVAFRGWLQQTGERRLRPVIAMLFGALLFAGFHSSGDWLPRMAEGLLLGGALLLTRSLWVTIWMHMLSNLLVVLASQTTWLDSSMAALAEAQPDWLRPAALVVNAIIAVAAVAVPLVRNRSVPHDR